MAQFIAYKPNIKVNTSLICQYLEVNIRGKEKRIEIFNNHGIDLKKQIWYPLEDVLNCFKAIHDTLGDMNLYLIGRAALKTPPFTNVNMKEAIEQFNILYHSHHLINDHPMYDPKTNTFLEGVGAYKVQEYNEALRKMIVVSSTHFSCKSDEGAIFAILDYYKPNDSKEIKITIDTTKERRTHGGHSCTYNISW